MPRESGSSIEGRIEDKKTAEVGAYKEEEIRKLGRIDEISNEDKEALVRIAEKHGEIAMREYVEDKESSPTGQLLNRIERLADKLEDGGDQKDVEILRKIRGRLEHYAKTVLAHKEEWEKRTGRSMSNEDLRARRHYGVDSRITISAEIGEGGGYIASPHGSVGTWGRAKDIAEVRDELVEKGTINGQPYPGFEILNHELSEEAQNQLFRELGVLDENREVKDLVADYSHEFNRQFGQRSSDSMAHPTDIEGVSLEIVRGPVLDAGTERKLNFRLSNEFIEKEILDRES